MEHALICPQCNAPLTPHRFAHAVVCSYCGTTVQLDELSVYAALFREAFRVWNAPQSYQVSSWLSIGDRYWAIDGLIAHGDISDVYSGRLARWPTELVILKLLRDPQDAGLFDNEWKTLQILQKSESRGADTFTRLIPQPVAHGSITAGSFAGRRVSIFRWASGFLHTFEEVLQVYPQGIPPQASIWVWRRILEVLAFIHNSGMVHGAVLPAHLLVQENEHGVRLVGYSQAGPQNSGLHAIASEDKIFYPQPIQSWVNLTPELDLAMSARCIAAILGGNAETASLPQAVPAPLAEIIKRFALSRPGDNSGVDAWDVREELGRIANQVFGPPRFIPIVMPA